MWTLAQRTCHGDGFPDLKFNRNIAPQGKPKQNHSKRLIAGHRKRGPGKRFAAEVEYTIVFTAAEPEAVAQAVAAAESVQARLAETTAEVVTQALTEEIRKVEAFAAVTVEVTTPMAVAPTTVREMSGARAASYALLAVIYGLF